MWETQQTEIYKEKWLTPLSLSIRFLIIIILSTTFLFAYNLYISSKNVSLQEQIDQKQIAIKVKKDNPLVQVYDLYIKNKTTIAKLEKQSDIVSFINHLDEISLTYNIELSGFDYSSWEIRTQALTISDKWKTLWSSSSYKKTSDFIKKYRLDKKVLFKLSFIETFTTNKTLSGNEEQTFALSFKLK